MVKVSSANVGGCSSNHGRVMPVTQNSVLKQLPHQTPGIMGSVLQLVGLVSVNCDKGRGGGGETKVDLQFSSQCGSTSNCEQIRPQDTRPEPLGLLIISCWCLTSSQPLRSLQGDLRRQATKAEIHQPRGSDGNCGSFPTLHYHPA